MINNTDIIHNLLFPLELNLICICKKKTKKKKTHCQLTEAHGEQVCESWEVSTPFELAM